MYFQWKPYVPVAKRRKNAQRAAALYQKKTGQTLAPVTGGRGAIASTFWGKAWCGNLECYSDYSNRLPRGRTYVRNGSVIDLRIEPGKVSAQVMGSDLYRITVNITEVPKAQWDALGGDCAGSIDSLVELLEGRLSKGVMERICRPQTGLFPSPKEIKFDCSCPDWAAMCKHVAAVLYGVGARLDEQPELLFTLRKVDAKELVARAGAGLPFAKKAPSGAKILDDSSLADVFGIEMADAGAPDLPVKTVAEKATSAMAKPSGTGKTSAKKRSGTRKTSSKKRFAKTPSAKKKSPVRKAPNRNAATGVPKRVAFSTKRGST